MADLRYKVVVDDEEAKRKISELLKGSGVSASGMGDGSVDAKKSATAVRQLTDEQKKLKAAQLENIESIRRLREERSKEISDLNVLKQLEQDAKTVLAEKKAATESLTQTEKELNIQYKQGQIEIQAYNKEIKEQAEERRKLNAEERAAEKILRDAEKARKDAEREAEKQRKAAEKRRKELEKENSAYYQLNKALGKVRKEAKDVLSEMFILEKQGLQSSAAYQELENKSKDLVKQTQILDKGIKNIDATLGLHQRNVGNYANALDNIIPIVGRVNSQLGMFGTSIDELAGKPGIFKEIGAGIAGAFKNLVAFVSTPVGAAVAIIGGLFALFQANKDTVIQFDDGLKSVSKTTGLSGKALKEYSDDIIQLSRSLKTVGTDKLLEYSQVAGQLGVKGRDNLLAFSDALAKLETASDIRGEEGATKIARLLTLTDGGVQNVKEFGDEIVNLGNNFAATESEILGNAEAIAQNVGLYKIGRKDVLAYATATKAVGLEAEVVGSTFSRTLGQFEKMTRSGKGVNDLLKIIGGTQADLQKRFKTDASGVFMDYIRGLNKINQAGGSVNEALERTGIIAVRDQRVIASLASTGYDTLTNAMNTAKNANGAMQAEFETGAGKLVNQIQRINIAWDNLVLSIENGSGAIGKTSVAIIGYVADILEAFNKIADSANIFEGVFRYISTGFKFTIPGRGIDWATGGGFDKVSNWLFPNDSKKSSEDNSKFFAEFSQKTREEQLKIIANQEEMIKKQNSLNKAFANPILSENLKKMRSLLKSDVDTAKVDFWDSDKDKRNAERIAEKGRQAAERQRSLQLEIDKINETASRNQLSRDESEVASVKDKYAKIREEVRKFYADPKNKGLRVDEGGLQRSENFEVAEATTRQDTKRIEQSFDAQKKLLDEYNAYAEQTSKEEADKRFASELAAFKGYEGNVEKAYFDLLAKKKTADLEGLNSTIKFTQAEEEQFKALSKRREDIANENRQRESKRIIEALQLSETYSDKILKVQEKYKKAYADLGEKATKEQKDQLAKGLKDETSAILVAQYQREVDTEKMYYRLSILSKRASIDAIAQARKALLERRKKGMSDKDFERELFQLDSAEAQVNLDKSWIASTGALKKYREQVQLYGKDSDQAKQAQKDMFTALASDLKNAQQIIGDVNGLLGSIGASEGLQNTVNQIGNLVGGMGELAAGIASGNPISIISGSIKTLTSALDIFNTKDKKLQKQIDAYRNQLDSLGKAYDTLQRRISNSVGENYYSDSDKAINNLKEQQRILAEIAQAEEDKKKTDKDKVRGYYDEIDSINKQIEDIQKSITENLVQTTFKDLSASLADALVTAFEAGESAVDSLDQTFDKFIKNALVNSLKLKMIEPIVNDMVNQLADYMKSNNNSLTGFNFSVWKDKIDGAGTEFTKTLEEAYKQLGLSKDGTSASGGLKGSIQREVTEATQSENNGLLRSQTELLKRSFDESKSQGITMGKQLAVAMDQLTALNAIQVNTGETVKRLDTAVSELQSINKNLGGRF